MKHDADVIVIGCGPSGAMAAAEIAIAGASVIVLERRTQEVESRAGTLLPRVMEILDSRGIADRFIRRMNQILPFPFRPGHIYAGLKGVNWKNLNSRFGFTLGLPQNHTEEILLAHARERGVEVRFAHEMTGLIQHDDHVEVTASTAEGEFTLRARYLVGADGGRSIVRQSLKIPFDGHGGTFSGMVVDAEIPCPWPAGNFGTDNAAGWMRGFAFGKNLTRINMVHRESMKQTKDKPVTIEEVVRNLNDIVGQDFGVKSFRWASRYDDTMRAVPRLREGRVFLVGESARIHYPASGVGMNFCLQDAFNLGWKLGLVCKGLADDALLDTYHEERMPVMRDLLESVQAQCALQFNFSNDGVALKRRFEATNIPVPAVNTELALELNGTGRAYEIAGAAHELTGRPMPDLDLVRPDGSVTRVGELLRGQHFLLLDLAGTGAFSELEAAGLPLTVIMAIASRRLDAARDATAVLVRPDGYVAWATDAAATPQAARAELRRWLSAPGL
ncbi:MAG: FAD-dependent oxidoreductase [Mesorhizobium sp.]|uniref:FAD-dependent monooxygenase n=1 Tax=Mesorhizobium sp. TaxID=1871066 RepID=UPI000FE86C1F|nr:FAD-dependent monooxygenase [Mesorhizobium sp.]RWI57077.1 MAG: FAD-dependent oxidoreductase [Mesorhizobium sp.]